MHRIFGFLVATAVGLALIGPRAEVASAASTLAPIAKIPIPGVPLNVPNPRGTGQDTDFIRFDPQTNLVYLTDGANKSVDRFDTNTLTMVDAITVSDIPHDAIVDDSINMMMAPLSSKNIAIVNLQTRAETDLSVGGTSIADLAGYDPATRTLFVGSKGQAQLSFIHIDPSGNSTILGQLPLTVSPEEPRFFNGKIYLSVPNQILVIDPTTRAITSSYSVPGCSGHGFAKGPGSEAYLGCTSGGLIVDLSTGSLIAQFSPNVISDTDQPAYDSRYNRYYAPGHITVNGIPTSVLAVFDASTHQLIGTFNIDPGSKTQAAADSNGIVYIAAAPTEGGACLSVCLFAYAPSAPAGRDFRVTSNGGGSISLSWNGGFGQSALSITRMGSAGTINLPAPANDATSASDNVGPNPTLACYQLTATSLGSAVRKSDLECVMANIATPMPLLEPMPISITLNQGSTATVTWTAVPGATGYYFVEHFNSRLQVLPASQLTATDNTGGAVDCYRVVVRGSLGTPAGISDAVCGAPGAGGSTTVAGPHLH